MDRNNGNASPDGHGEISENDKKRMRRPNRAKTFKVEINFASKIPLQAIVNALRGQDSDNYQEAIRVLDIILRQHAAKQCVIYTKFLLFHKYISLLNFDNSACYYLLTIIFICRGCLLVRQSFFHNDPKNFADVGGGVLGCRGFHSSFRTTQSGLSLNIGIVCWLDLLACGDYFCRELILHNWV